MNGVICTLFEGGYHVGVAALINSLIRAGFEGDVVVGYRGELPTWADSMAAAPASDGVNLRQVAGAKVRIRFQPFDTKGHFTNVKPQFMYSVWAMYPDADAIFYFDPDIIVFASWSFFERWVGEGVGMAEDASPPLPRGHPKRRLWREYFGARGLTLTFREAVYANGGFVGVARPARSFVSLWERMMVDAESAIGGLDVSNLPGGRAAASVRDINGPFYNPDQDVLNAAVEAFDGEVTILGKEAMGFAPGGHVMCHAVNAPKPWGKPFVRNALRGFPPTVADKLFFKQSATPIDPFSSWWFVWRKKVSLLLAVLIGRFYSRRY